MSERVSLRLMLVLSLWLLAGIAVHSAYAQNSEVSGQILDPAYPRFAGAGHIEWDPPGSFEITVDGPEEPL
jgi:hypothetical protein